MVRSFGSFLVVAMAGCLGVAVTGCGLGGFSAVSTAPSALPAIAGNLHGGQQPVVGASIQLYAANVTASKGMAKALLATPAVTKADGSFSIDKETDYSCPTPGSLIYLVATDGTPKVGGPVNPQLALMALVGTCGSLTDSTFIQVNELTTVAGVEALAPFMTDYAHVGADASNPNALAGAFAQAQATVDFTTGNFATPAGGATVPTQLLNSLADILAACVNTGGGTANDGSGSACSTLLGSAGTGTATETIGAMLQIVQHPATNVTALFGLISGGAPFQPGMGTQPEDFVEMEGAYLPIPAGTDTSSSFVIIPYQIAIDSYQNVWIYTPVITSFANNTSSPGDITVYKNNNMQLLATFRAGSGGLYSPSQLAADAFGNVWALNSNSTLSKFSVAGGAMSPAGGYSFPLVYGGSTEVGPTGNAAEVISSMSIDPSGNVWAVYNYQCYIEFANDGSVVQNPSGSSFPFCGNLPLLALPNSIATDSSGNILLFDQSNASSVLKLDPAGDLLSPAAGYTQGGFSGQYSSVDLMVYDRSQGQLWLSNDSNGQSLDAIKDDGTAVSGANGFNLPPTLFSWAGMAVDGAGNLWIADQFTNTLNGISPTGSSITPTTLYNPTGTIMFPGAIAVDGYGTIWVANWGNSVLTRVLGLAVPKNYQ